MRRLFFIPVLIISVFCYSQNNAEPDSIISLPRNLFFKTSQIIRTDSGIYITQFTKLGCKNHLSETKFYPNPVAVVVLEKINPIQKIVEVVKPVKFLTIHGNVYYDFFYRSAIDTPINQKNFQQHTERINLELMVKEKYPLRVSFTARQSNSPYFRNFFDPNFQFDRFVYVRNAKQTLLRKINAQLPDRPDLKLAEAALKEEMDRYTRLKKKYANQTTLQKIIEDRESGLGSKSDKANNDKIKKGFKLDSLVSIKDTLSNMSKSFKNNMDSSVQTITSLYEKEKSLLDSVSQKVKDLQRKTDSLKNTVQMQIVAARQKINKATSQRELLKIANEYGIKPENRENFEKKLASVKNFSIGRSILNYTELTAQNITITGVNIEYNSSYYAAIAVGKIDYRFRDFYNNKNSDRNSRNNQYLVMGRLGLGDKEKKAIIFSLFQGKKNTAEYSLSDTVKNYVNLMGYSIEAIYKKDENTSFSAEFAKSTKPVSGNFRSNKQTGVLWNYADKTNMGINVKAQTMIPETNTRLSGFYRKTGENFQSFSLFSYNTNQTAWLTRFDQSFYKDRISITGMLRRNDFTNPFTDKTFKTSTVFKSVLLNVRFPKYPSLSIGYYPGTQLYFVNKDIIRENAYYILNGSLVYSYFLRNRGMNTT